MWHAVIYGYSRDIEIIKIGKNSCPFVLSFFPRDVLDKILDLIESVSEGFPTYF